MGGMLIWVWRGMGGRGGRGSDGFMSWGGGLMC
jgi:hypothetical protein